MAGHILDTVTRTLFPNEIIKYFIRYAVHGKSFRSSYGVLHILLQMQCRPRAFDKCPSILVQSNATNLYKNM